MAMLFPSGQSAAADELSLISRRKLNRLHQILFAGRRYLIGKKQMVQCSDDRFRPLVNVIKSGYVKRYTINNDGSIATQAIYGPNDVFPLSLIYEKLLNQNLYAGPEVIYYETLTKAEIYSCETISLKEYIENEPAIYHDILVEIGVRTMSNIQRLENISLRSSIKRVAHQLVFLARQFGEHSTTSVNSVKLSVPLTHQDIADILSLTRETVSVNMHRLKKLKLLGEEQTAIEVLDLSGLERIAYS